MRFFSREDSWFGAIHLARRTCGLVQLRPGTDGGETVGNETKGLIGAERRLLILHFCELDLRGKSHMKYSYRSSNPGLFRQTGLLQPLSSSSFMLETVLSVAPRSANCSVSTLRAVLQIVVRTRYRCAPLGVCRLQLSIQIA